MTHSRWRLPIVALCALAAAINFWFFSRLTIDDAFITWRYGHNLVSHGIWNYNPSFKDMTNAYTNAVYAFCGIVPALLKIDVVLFFKVVSLATILWFWRYYAKKTRYGALIVLGAFVLPETTIHAFSGLETFLFVALLTALLISIHEESLSAILAFSCLLFYTRPESLPLLAVVPLLYCDWRRLPRGIERFATRKAIVILIVLLVFLLPNLLISYLHFGHVLPNSFFVKNAAALSWIKLVQYGAALLPLLLLFRYLPLKKLIPLSLFFGAIALQYSKTHFSMDYHLRSVYHIFAPISFFVFYLAGKDSGEFAIRLPLPRRRALSLKYKSLCVFSVLAVWLFFLSSRESVADLLRAANYYQRTLSAHAAAGKVINEIKEKQGIHAMACGDAGTIALNGDLESLDLHKLGSAFLTREGFEKAYSLYRPEILFLHGNAARVRKGLISREAALLPEKSSALPDANQAGDRQLAQYHYLGRLVWNSDYYLWTYSRKNTEIPELTQVFAKSQAANFKTDLEMLQEHLFSPPWSLWHK